MEACVAKADGMFDLVGIAYGPDLAPENYHYQRCWLYREAGDGGPAANAVAPAPGVFCYSFE